METEEKVEGVNDTSAHKQETNAIKTANQERGQKPLSHSKLTLSLWEQITCILYLTFHSLCCVQPHPSDT